MWVIMLRELLGEIAFDGMIFLALALGSLYYAVRSIKYNGALFIFFLLIGWAFSSDHGRCGANNQLQSTINSLNSITDPMTYGKNLPT
jgi:hypothetical protein